MAAAREVIVVSNREPCLHDVTADGEIIARRPLSGVVTALEAVVRQRCGVWVAHGSGSADRLTADQQGHVAVGCPDSSYLLRRVWLTPEEERGYHYGFASEGLWPLCHMASSAPIFRPRDWLAYEAVNRRFTEAIAEEIRSADPIVLVQDNHLALVPRLLRDRCPDAIVLAFWPMPWPNAERLSLCPYRHEIVSGLLGSDIVGFQALTDGDRFLDCAEHAQQWSVDRRHGAIEEARGPVLVRSYPTSVDWSIRWPSQLPPVDQCRRSVRAQLGIDDATGLVVSIDRLDDTPGPTARLGAIERLLERAGATGRRVAVLQIAALTRFASDRQTPTRARTEILRINQRFGGRDFTPVTYTDQCMDPADVFRCYRAADVCYVGGRDDAMNLIAREFVAARDDEHGVLVLSQSAAAARELLDAMIINPDDVDGVAVALAQALVMSEVEQQARMREMRGQINAHHSYNWASEMLADAEQLRPIDFLDRRAIDDADVQLVPSDEFARHSVASTSGHSTSRPSQIP